MKCQSKFNSPLFVSHGIDHSFRVAEYAIQIYNKSPLFLAALQDKLGVKYKETTILTCLLHDVGYIEYEYDQGDPQLNAEISTCLSEFKCECDGCGINSSNKRKFKYLHAKLGAEWIKKAFPDSDIFSAAATAVEYHNSDSISDSKYDPNKHGKLCSLDTEYSRPYLACSVDTHPLLSLLRIVDNLDITSSRLSAEQRDHIFIQFQKDMAEGIHYTEEDKIKKISEITRNDPNLREEVVSLLVINTNEHEFKFQYSNWIWSKVTIDVPQDKSYILSLECETINVEGNEQLSFKNNVKAGIFQFERMIDSFKSIKLTESDTGTIEDKIYVTIHDRGREYASSLIDIFSTFQHIEVTEGFNLMGGYIKNSRKQKSHKSRKRRTRKRRTRKRRTSRKRRTRNRR